MDPSGRLRRTWWDSGRDEFGGEVGLARAFVDEVDGVSLSGRARAEPVDSDGEVGEVREVADESDGCLPSVDGRAGVAGDGGRRVSNEISECFPPSNESSSSSPSSSAEAGATTVGTGMPS